MRAEGVDVVNLSAGEPDFATQRSVVEQAKTALDNGLTRYGKPGGGPELKTVICEKFQRDNELAYTPDQITVGAGAKQILLHAFLTHLNPGDEVLVLSPYWVSYADQIKFSGGNAKFVSLLGLKGPEDLRARLQENSSAKTKCIVFSSPSNPTGEVLGAEVLKTIASFATEQKLWVISDEIYEYLVFEGKHQSILNVMPSLAPQTLLVNGLSKAFAMTGWRVGYAAGPDQVIARMRMLQSHSSTCLPGFIEKAAITALKGGKQLIAEDLDKYRVRRNVALDQAKMLQDSVGIGHCYPKGAFYVFLDLRPVLHNSVACKTSLEFGTLLLEKHHVGAVPGEAFGAPGFLRTSYATSEEQIKRGYAGIKACAQEVMHS
jgi:aspartate aminotransferase